MKAIIGALADPGHAYPAIALATELDRRGHAVTVQIASESWREPVEAVGLRFEPIPAHAGFAERDRPRSGPPLAEVVAALAPRIEAARPDVVVADAHGYPHALAAEAVGARRATLISTLYPVFEPGLPPYPFGFRAPRTALGRAGWRALAGPIAGRLLAQGREQLNRERAQAGLPAVERLDSQISDELVIVATFPQLEYPRRWPEHVHVSGPIFLEQAQPAVELPQGDGPVVVVASSSVFDPELRLLGAALEALAGEPVRVLGTASGRAHGWSGRVPANARVVDWLDYGAVLPEAAAVVTHGGHGIVARALQEGVPLLVCPGGADQAENGARLAWAGAGLRLMPRLLAPRTLRWALRRLLADERFTVRAGEIADWGRANPGLARAADLLERQVEASGG